ncbi:MAG: NapC/NirT family cytochrome c [Verrucomicrobia bacterium]|jgi:formate dehydrogenase gamma subunit|nr:NapC/NirT family cytochrome c [Verrucomicrobiota bacterium]
MNGKAIGACWLLGVVLTVAAAPEIKNSHCLDCHEDETLTKTDASGREVSVFVDAAKLAASVHRTNTCVSCHTDVTEAHPDDDVPAKPVNCSACHERQSASYGASVHGRALAAGVAGAATCQDCHGAHEVVSPKFAASPLHVTRQAEMCGECHAQAAEDYAASVHGRALAAGVRDAPTCTDCHYEHQIASFTGSQPQTISEEVCSRCHASERLNTRYNLPRDRVKTFFESYHGLAAQYGSTVAANCGSCHGYHKILPSSDPDSMIHPTHLVETCGNCHPGATERFVAGKIHVDLTSATRGEDWGSAINWWVRRIYLLLIVGVIGAMFTHNLLLLVKKVKAHLSSAGRPILRMNASQRWQHAVLALSFIVLAVTGFALRFPDSWVARLLGSSEPFRRWTHRVAGVVLLAVGLYHIVYILATREGRRLIKDFLPTRQDLADVVGALKYLVGFSATKPRIGRFGYAEKMEYWAVVWGTIIMGTTGLMIWFKMDVTVWLPRWAVDVALTIHYYEAILACLAIVVWHFYHVMFDPDVYPLNLACWDGRVSEHWHAEEHPLETPQHETAGKQPVAPTAPASEAAPSSSSSSDDKNLKTGG